MNSCLQIYSSNNCGLTLKNNNNLNKNKSELKLFLSSVNITFNCTGFWVSFLID